MLKIINSDQFELAGSQGRMIHCASIHDTHSMREFILFYDIKTHARYIEEISAGHLIQIPEEELWEELSFIAREKELFPITIIK